jgi:hypothetical protein
MKPVTYFVALPFLVDGNGELYAGAGIECPSGPSAVRKAAALLGERGVFGAIAFSRTGNPATGDWQDAVILAQIGKLPGDVVGFLAEAA